LVLVGLVGRTLQWRLAALIDNLPQPQPHPKPRHNPNPHPQKRSRSEGYDAPDLTTQYLNLPEVRKDLKAREDILYVSCSPEVDKAMGHDVMKSTAHLVPDLLAYSHVMLYHGQVGFDGGLVWGV